MHVTLLKCILLLNFIGYNLAKEKLSRIIADETANLIRLFEESETMRDTLNQEEKNELDEVVNKRKELLDNLLKAETENIDKKPINKQSVLDKIVKKRISLLHQLLKHNKTKEILEIIKQVGKEHFMLNIDELFGNQTETEKKIEVHNETSFQESYENETSRSDNNSIEQNSITIDTSNKDNKSLENEIDIQKTSECESNDNSSTELIEMTTLRRAMSRRKPNLIRFGRPRLKVKPTRYNKTLSRQYEKKNGYKKEFFRKAKKERPYKSTSISTPDLRNYFDTTSTFFHNTADTPHSDFKTNVLGDENIEFNEILQNAEKLYVTKPFFEFCFDSNTTDFNTNHLTSKVTEKTIFWSDKDIVKSLGQDPFIQRLLKIYMKKNQEYIGAKKKGLIQYFGYKK